MKSAIVWCGFFKKVIEAVGNDCVKKATTAPAVFIKTI